MKTGVVAKDGKGRRPDRAAVIFVRLKQQACAVRGVRLFAAGVFFVIPDRLHALLEGLIRLPQVMEYASEFGVGLCLEVTGKTFRPARHPCKVGDERLPRMCERLVRIHGLYAKERFNELKVGAT